MNKSLEELESKQIENLISTEIPKLPDMDTDSGMYKRLEDMKLSREEIENLEKEMEDLGGCTGALEKLFGAARRKRRDINIINQKITVDTALTLENVVKYVKKQNEVLDAQNDLIRSNLSITIFSYLDSLKDRAAFFEEIGDLKIKSLLDNIRLNKSMFGWIEKIFNRAAWNVYDNAEEMFYTVKDRIYSITSISFEPFYDAYHDKLSKGEGVDLEKGLQEAVSCAFKEYNILLKEYDMSESDDKVHSIFSEEVGSLISRVPDKRYTDAYETMGFKKSEAEPFLWMVFMGVVKKQEIAARNKLMEIFIQTYLKANEEKLGRTIDL